jgi:molybdopterin-guanine dinucleotide biosynthesis protein A
MSPRVLGAVLAGGRSRRFGGDKAEAVLAGRRLIDWVAEALSPYCGEVVIVGRSDAVLRSVADAPDSGLGPLGGLCGALLAAEREGYDVVLTAGCDLPLLPPLLVDKLLAEPPAFVDSQPLLGAWPANLAGALPSYLAQGEDRSMYGWAEHAAARRIHVEAELPNVNTPADLESLEKEIRRREGPRSSR